VRTYTLLVIYIYIYIYISSAAGEEVAWSPRVVGQWLKNQQLVGYRGNFVSISMAMVEMKLVAEDVVVLVHCFTALVLGGVLCTNRVQERRSKEK
jgi:hypothetical protein